MLIRTDYRTTLIIVALTLVYFVYRDVCVSEKVRDFRDALYKSLRLSPS